jgi:hypothetical protein
MSIGKVNYASEVAALKFKTGRFDVWKKTNLFREPLFKHSLFIISFYGIVGALLQSLYKTKVISLPTKEFLYPLLYLCPIMGGLYLIGGLNLKRTRLAVFYMLIYAVFKYVVFKYCYNEYSFIDIFQVIPGLWLIVWWMAKEPNIVSSLGIRKKHILSDFLTALFLASIFLAYSSHLFIVNGLKLKFHIMESSIDFITYIIQGLFLNNYYFAVWNLLKNKGANTLQNMMALLLVFSVIQAPAFIAFSLMGVVKPQLAVAGFAANSMLTLIVIHFSFSVLKNSLTATFLMATIMLLLKMAGIL